MKTWRTPNLKGLKIEELAKIITAKADSSGTGVGDLPSCQGAGECSCGTKCEALAFYWSCYYNMFYRNENEN